MRRSLILGSVVCVLVSGISVLVAPGATSQPVPKLKPCKGNPSLVGACYTVHGRFRFHDGAPSSRVWIVGTHRMLGVDETTNVEKDRAEVPWIPANLESRVGPGIDVFGDYEVCPLSKEKAGEMQFVCVESAAHLVIKDWNKQSDH
jgi:hypothetical protein